MERLKAARPCGRVRWAPSQRRRRGIVVVVNRHPTKRRQARHLRKKYPEYAAPPELGNSHPALATTMPRLRRSLKFRRCVCSIRMRHSRNRQTSEVLPQSRRVSYWTNLYGSYPRRVARAAKAIIPHAIRVHLCSSVVAIRWSGTGNRRRRGCRSR